MPRPKLTKEERAEWAAILNDVYRQINEYLADLGTPDAFEPDTTEEEEDLHDE